MKMFKNLFSGKKEEPKEVKAEETKSQDAEKIEYEVAPDTKDIMDAVKKEVKNDTAELLAAQDAPRTEPLQGTEEEIGKQAEDGMKAMGFTPVTENALLKDYEAQDAEPQVGKWKPRIRGNDYCPCGSGKKFKKCCVSDTKKVDKFSKSMDIRIENAKTIRILKNIKIRSNKKAKKDEQMAEKVRKDQELAKAKKVLESETEKTIEKLEEIKI